MTNPLNFLLNEQYQPYSLARLPGMLVDSFVSN